MIVISIFSYLRHISILAFVFFSLLTLRDISAAAPSRTLSFEQLSVKQGLAQETVTAIVQDQQGFMWFGSQHGLSRFDGYRVTVYKSIPNDPHSLADNWVQALYVDKKNRLWVGSRGGLQRFDPGSESFTRFLPDETLASGSGKRHVQTIISDGYNQLWIGTNDGLQHFDPESGRFVILRHNPADDGSLNNDRVTSLTRDDKGNLWVGMMEGIDLLLPGSKRFQHFRVDSSARPEPAHNEVRILWIDHKQTLWIVTMAGLETWQLGDKVRKKYRFGPAEGLHLGMITALFQDQDANVWLGTNTNGLHRWDAARGRFIAYPADPYIVASKEVSALYQDHTGTLWVGTWTAGVKRVDLASGGFNRFFHVPGDSKSLSDNRIFGITGDEQGKLWLATFGAINRLDPVTGEVTVFQHDPDNPNSLSNEEVVLTIFLDRRQQFWAGTSAGLGRFNPATGNFSPRLFQTGDSNSDSITHVGEDRSGALWVSSRGGLHRLDSVTDTARTFRHDASDAASLTDNWVKMTLEDRHGALWVATDDGLDRLDIASGRFTHFRHQPNDINSLSSDRVQYLFEDKKGTLWVGTNGGLNKIERSADGAIRFHSYTTKDGLGADSIGSILEKNDGYIWLSTAAGISRFDPAAGMFRNYTAHDGMIEGYFYAGSAFHGRDGAMYFGGVNGLTAFRPEAIRDNPHPPPVLVTDIQISGKSLRDNAKERGFNGAIQDTKAITLAHGHSIFSLEFSALHYADPQRNRFAYQLQGFDKDWVSTDSNKRIATYTNLDPGRYLFRVKAANKDGVWNEAGATLAITITPPIWATWWFRTLATLLIISIGWVAYRARVRLLTDQKKLLEKQVAARTSEVVLQKEIVEQKNALLEYQKQEVEHQKTEAETAHRNISALSDIGRKITATLDRNTIMASVYEHIAQLMKTDVFCIGLAQEDQNKVEFPFWMEQGKLVPIDGARNNSFDQLAWWCIARRREIIINDFDVEGRTYAEAFNGVLPLPKHDVQFFAAKSLMIAPMFVNDSVVGIIGVQCAKKNAYQRVHLDMLLSLTAYAGVALDNADAYLQLQDAQQQLQRYLEDRERLFISISHDLRTPITRLKLRTELLDDDSTREEFHDDLDELDMMVKGALQCVKDSNIHENPTEIRLDALIKRMIRGAQLAGHAVSYSESGLSVIAKPLALKRAIGNLLDNALYYGERAEISVHDSATHIEIQIRDHGPGVAEEAFGSLFQSYVRLEHGRDQNESGMGLGLGIALSIVEAHGGELLLANHAEGGLVATIRMPKN